MSEIKVRRRHLRAAVYHEASLIDARRFDAWYDLFTDDALYWMPLARGQSEDDIHNSLFFEDKLLLKVRIARLASPRAFSQQPASHCQHVLQEPQIDLLAAQDNRYQTQTPFIYVESQLDTQWVLAGTVHHQFVIQAGSLHIRRKRIELLNRDAALPSIQLFL